MIGFTDPWVVLGLAVGLPLGAFAVLVAWSLSTVDWTPPPGPGPSPDEVEAP